jgi:citrate synthase
LSEIKKGLEDATILETRIAFIDGEKGILQYRGHDINDLSKLSYVSVAYLLLNGKLPEEKELEDFAREIKSHRKISFEIRNVLNVCNFNVEAMEALRTAVSYMSHCDVDLKDNSFEANIRKTIRLIAKFPTVVAAFKRVREGLDPFQPDPSLTHGENFLYLLTGKRPDPLDAESIEKDFILSAEHELNASTFAARIAASTRSDIHSGVVSGLSTLNGELHGGARMKVMDMLDEIGTPDNAGDYVMNLISKKERIMGFGHRVYKTYDPRAVIYKSQVEKIAKAKNDSTWFEMAQNIENTVLEEMVKKKNRPIYPNVDFYSGVLYKYLDIPPLLATSVFAIGRVSGWCAHIMEQYADNRLIRPRAKFVK